MDCNWCILKSVIIIASLCNPNQEYQTSISKNQNFIFGEFFYLIFMDLYDNTLKNIGDEFFKFDCKDM